MVVWTGASDVILAPLKRAAAAPALNPNLLTALRTATNCFRQAGMRGWLREHRAEVGGKGQVVGWEGWTSGDGGGGLGSGRWLRVFFCFVFW